MKTLLYFYPQTSSFVESDHQLLNKYYRVIPFWFNTKKKILTPWYFLKQLCFILWNCRRSSVMVSQFSGYHSFLPSVLGRWFQRPHVIMLHGTECNNFPEYRYGFLIRPILFWFSKISLANAAHLLPVSRAMIEQDYTYSDTTYSKQGLHAFYPKVKTPTTIIHNGISTEKFFIDHTINRIPNSFITVASGIGDNNRFKIKGLDLICDLATRLPHCHFSFVGSLPDKPIPLPPNIELLGYIPNENLARIYNQYKVYLQLSVTEGFGISVAEAMLCGCIPIVSNVGMLPEIAGPNGYVLKKKNVDDLEVLVHRVLGEADKTPLEKYHQWILDQFSIAKREMALFNVLRSLNGSK